MLEVVKLNGGKYKSSLDDIIDKIQYGIKHVHYDYCDMTDLKNEVYDFCHVILKGDLSSVLYIDIDNFCGLDRKYVWKTIGQVITEYFGEDYARSFYLLKSCSFDKYHIYFYELIVSRLTGLSLMREINKRLCKPVLDELNGYRTCIRFEGSCKWDKHMKKYLSGTNYVLFGGTLYDNILFYKRILNFGSDETDALKPVPQVNKSISKRKNVHKTKVKHKPISLSTTDLLAQVKCLDTKDKPTIEIKCREDILKAIHNNGDYYQTYHIWWAIGIACKRVGVNHQIFEEWTGDTAIG